MPETVSYVDLDRYLGTWYEIARIPNWFQDRCVGNVTADYSRLDTGNLAVVNSCVQSDGQVDAARGVARVVDDASNSKLEVSFFSLFGWQLFWGDYWILGLGDDYEYAVVGMPSRKYAWILARTRQLPAELRGRIDKLLRDAGYDPSKLMETQHDNQY